MTSCLQVWMEVSQCIFDLVMEGYSQVRKVSPEGRSAMTMDVFALHDGLNSIHLCRYHHYHYRTATDGSCTLNLYSIAGRRAESITWITSSALRTCLTTK